MFPSLFGLFFFVCKRGQACATRPREEGCHAISKVRRAVVMKIPVDGSKRSNITTVRKRLKTVRGEELIRVDPSLSSNNDICILLSSYTIHLPLIFK